METIRIPAYMVAQSHYYVSNHTVGVQQAYDPSVYFVDADYYAASMFDRGYITVSSDQ